jgi:hypothetical protein
VKKVGAVSLAVALTGIVLVAGLPVVAHAASASLADLATGASSSYNSVMAKLAASGFLQAFSLVFVSEIGDKTFFIAGAWLDLVCVCVLSAGGRDTIIHLSLTTTTTTLHPPPPPLPPPPQGCWR